jgi:hypothetical protein
MDSETHVMLETFLYNEVNESNEIIILFLLKIVHTPN